MNGLPRSTQLQAAAPITWTQRTFLVLLRRHLQTMMKAVEELRSEWWVSYVALSPWESHLLADWLFSEVRFITGR